MNSTEVHAAFLAEFSHETKRKKSYRHDITKVFMQHKETQMLPYTFGADK